MASIVYVDERLRLRLPAIGSGGTGGHIRSTWLMEGRPPTVAGLMGASHNQPAADVVLGGEGAVVMRHTSSDEPQQFFYTTTSIDLGSSALGIVLGGTLILGNWVSEGLETIYKLHVAGHAPNVSPAYEMFFADTAPVKPAVTVDSLKSHIVAFLSEAEYEDLEIGVASTLSRHIRALVTVHGATAMEALRDVLQVRLPSDEVMSVLLRQLGRVRHRGSHRLRRDLLIDLLRSNSVRVRHAAATGLAELDDPTAIRALEGALAREPHERPREHLQLVLEQLRDTERCLSTS